MFPLCVRQPGISSQSHSEADSCTLSFSRLFLPLLLFPKNHAGARGVTWRVGRIAVQVVRSRSNPVLRNPCSLAVFYYDAVFFAALSLAQVYLEA